MPPSYSLFLSGAGHKRRAPAEAADADRDCPWSARTHGTTTDGSPQRQLSAWIAKLVKVKSHKHKRLGHKYADERAQRHAVPEQLLPSMALFGRQLLPTRKICRPAAGLTATVRERPIDCGSRRQMPLYRPTKAHNCQANSPSTSKITCILLMACPLLYVFVKRQGQDL